jgi:hypothetical protein
VLTTTTLVLLIGAVVAAAAAVRSTWSPCGLSMLSTITPFGERGRGHRYGWTAGWFIVGATLGGATLGAGAAGLAAVASAAGVAAHPGWVAGLIVLAAAAAAGIDAGVFGAVIPIWRRQVDDRWLARYRSWVYGVGFGWQIGVGVATYIMTAAVFLVVVLAGLTADPVAAVGLGSGFGFVRGLAVLLTARADSPARLRAIHRRVDRAGPVVRTAVIAVEVAAGLVVVVAQWPLAGAAGAVTAVVALTAVMGPSVVRRARGRAAAQVR